ncbi:MAG: HD domain-containing protein [Bacteroidales bacterium]|nr:HD domain-containing protein [Bacteroidales bacterium]
MKFEEVKRYLLNKLHYCLAPDLYYHGVQHTLSVMEAAELYAENEAIFGKERSILLTAALFHDSGYLVRYENNESISVGLCWTVLPEFGYKNEDIQYIVKLIEATSVPQKPFDKLSKILCDADLDYLGRDDYFEMSCNLRKEWDAYGKKLSHDEWFNVQIKFLSSHKYFTHTAHVLREAKKLKHLRMIKESLVTI